MVVTMAVAVDIITVVVVSRCVWFLSALWGVNGYNRYESIRARSNTQDVLALDVAMADPLAVALG